MCIRDRIETSVDSLRRLRFGAGRNVNDVRVGSACEGRSLCKLDGSSANKTRIDADRVLNEVGGASINWYVRVGRMRLRNSDSRRYCCLLYTSDAADERSSVD